MSVCGEEMFQHRRDCIALQKKYVRIDVLH